MTQTHTPAPSFDFVAHLARQAAWSEKTFGPGPRVEMVLDHIRKELTEIEAEPGDLEEWVDLIILALDGAWRAGANPQQIIAGIVAKQTKNEGRSWPDWRMADPNKAIEHVRLLGATPAHAILDEHTTPAILGEAKAPTIRDAMRWSGCDPDYHGRIAFSPDQLEKFVSFFHCPSPTTRGEAKAVAPEGWKLVPIQPTAEMIAAGLEHTKLTTDEDDDPKLYRAKGQAAAVYHFMLDAVPIAPALPVTDGVRWDLFPGWLIDHIEGEPLTEEGLQFQLSDMIAFHKENPPSPVAAEKDAEIARLNEIINQPMNNDFLRGVSIEAEHQRQKWGEPHDRSKSAENWFWLVGYLAGKCLRAVITGDKDKARHHTIISAAALFNWHKAISRDETGSGIGADIDIKPRSEGGHEGENALQSPAGGGV